MKVITGVVAIAVLGLGACQTRVPPAELDNPAERKVLEVREGYAENRGARLYYRSIGRGEPIFVLHGGPGLDHTYLLPQMDELAQYFKLVYLDQRLCGKSDADVEPETINFETFVEDIDAVRAELGLNKIHLLGHSWGGLVAMHYAIAHPERLQSLILSNSVAARADLWQEENQLLSERLTPEDQAEREAIVASAAFKAEDPAAFADLFRLGFRRQLHEPERVGEITLTLPADFRARSMKFGAIAPQLADYDLTEQLREFNRPTLIVYGDAEASAGISGPHLATTIPGAKLTVLGRSGHFPYIENAEAFFATVREFINES
jgi:proline iminopeptidase